MSVSSAARAALLLFTISIATSLSLFGQAVTGTISGNVADPSGGVLSNATVRAINADTSETRNAVTDAQGSYLFPTLVPGRYRIETEANGFKRSVREGISLGVNQNARVDFTLEVGSLTQEVHVAADAPLVDTREAQVGFDRGSRTGGSSAAERTKRLQPRIDPSRRCARDDTHSWRQHRQSRLSQWQPRSPEQFPADGANNNSMFRNGGNQAPNPDAVGEFRLLTSNFDAEFGRLSGAVINVVTRSGTNQFHGAVFEYLRNNNLNARNFFQPSVTALHQNQFGATTGGPVIRNKTFFFASYQGLRISTAAFINSGITPTGRSGRAIFPHSRRRSGRLTRPPELPFPTASSRSRFSTRYRRTS